MNETCLHDVLIVDDSPAMRKFVRRVLEISGFAIGELNEAVDGLDALKFLSRRPVDLILTDVNMPVMGGEEFMARVASESGMKEIPVVVISTDSTRQRTGRMMALGASGYVAKPFSPEILRAELERVMAGRAS
jgi:two-component system chemotaxis response regulator CheY